MAQEKPVATWKVWWCYADVAKCADALQKHVVPASMPGGGEIVKISRPICHKDLRCPNTSGAIEAILRIYPSNKCPSAYFFADAIIEYNRNVNYSLLGQPEVNPVKEQSRRDLALREGKKLALLLAYMRRQAKRSGGAKYPVVEYLKTLVPKGSRLNCSPETARLLAEQEDADPNEVQDGHNSPSGEMQNEMEQGGDSVECEHGAGIDDWATDDVQESPHDEAYREIDVLLGIADFGDGGATPVLEAADEACLDEVCLDNALLSFSDVDSASATPVREAADEACLDEAYLDDDSESATSVLEAADEAGLDEACLDDDRLCVAEVDSANATPELEAADDACLDEACLDDTLLRIADVDSGGDTPALEAADEACLLQDTLAVLGLACEESDGPGHHGTAYGKQVSRSKKAWLPHMYIYGTSKR